MSLPAFFASPRRSRAATAALHSMKAGLAVCALTLLLAAPSQAGHWEFSLDGSTTVPGGSVGNYQFANSQVLGPDYPYAGPTFHPYFDLGSGSCYLNMPGDCNSSMTATAKLTWTPNYPGDTSPTPATVDVLEQGGAHCSIVLQDGVSETLTALDGLEDIATQTGKTAGDTGPYTNYVADSHGSQLVHLTVPTGQNWVKLPTRSLSTSSSYQPPGYSASGKILSYGVQQASPPKSILINRPENAGANIEADRKIFDFSTGEWTCYGDSRFSNDVYGSRYSGSGGYSILIGGEDFGWEDWTMDTLGSPWPSEASMHTLSIPDPWSRNWHWYAENGSTSPPTSLGFDSGDTYYVSTFAPHVRPHKDWPYSASPGFFDPVYIPHDLLEEMASSSVPGPETRRINLHLTDSVWTGAGAGDPEWAFDHSANFNITYHNQFELITQGTPSFVTSTDIPWEMAKGPDGQPISQSAYNNPILGWGPQLQYYVEANWQVNINFVSWAGYSGGQNTGNGTTSTVGPTDIPPNSIGVVYQRPHKMRFPFTYRHYLAAGREIYGYDSQGKEIPFSSTVDRSPLGFGTHPVDYVVFIFPNSQPAIPPTIGSDPPGYVLPNP